MANRLQVRHGSTSPTNSDLLPYELGWDGSDLYINNNGTIKNVAEHIASGYLPLTGGTLTGNLNMGTTSMVNGAKIFWYSKHNNDNTSRQIWAGYANDANTFYLYDSTNQNGIIQSTAAGNTTFYGNATSATNATNATNATTAVDTTYDDTCTVSAGDSNEVNFGGTNTSTTIYFGYRARGSRPQPSTYIFGSSNNGTATIKADKVYGAGCVCIRDSGTTARKIWTTTSASVPSGAVAGDIVLVKV